MKSNIASLRASETLSRRKKKYSYRPSEKNKLTDTQFELLRLILKGNEDGSHTDLDQLLERASHRPTKQSIQFCIRALIQKECIGKLLREKRRGARRAVYAGTIRGVEIFKQERLKRLETKTPQESS